MSKVHITLVGGQPMPVYNGIKYCKPEKVLFIYSKESEKQKQTLKKEIIEAGLVKDSDVLSSQPLDPVDLEEIEKKAIEYKERFANDEITINISSGTKVWSYYFSTVFENSENAQIYYIDQNNECYNLVTKQHEKVETDVMVQFKLNKNPLQSYKLFSDYTDTDLAMIKEIERIRNTNIQAFTELTNLERNQEDKIQEDNGIIKCKGSYIKWQQRGECEIGINNKKCLVQETLKSPNILQIIFNASWFELKVAHILSKWDKAKNIYMNCKFLVNSNGNDFGKKQAEKFPKNEVDIIVDIGEKVLFVECKTGITHSTDIDKFNTVVKNMGGNGSKAIFICLYNFRDIDKEKFRDSNMLSFSFSESKDVKDLYDKLNREVGKINK